MNSQEIDFCVFLKKINRGRGSTSAADSARAFHCSSSSVHTSVTDQDRTGLRGLSDAQWRTLVQLLNKKTESTTPKIAGTLTDISWIIDTGATNHMTGCLSILSDVRTILPIPVKLPDGRLVSATKTGNVSLCSALILQNVLVVDGLQCHLISVSQLNRDSKCVFQITDKLCVVQDRITKTLIGVGEQSNGLYFFRSVDPSFSLYQVETSSSDLWHHRLGHPS